MSIKYFTWFMKSRNKIDTVKGVDEHGDFKSRQWEDKNGNPCYNQCVQLPVDSQKTCVLSERK